MKVVHCKNCRDTIFPISGKMRKCFCGKTATKYLKDNLTLVMTKEFGIVYGIDSNVGLRDAIRYADQWNQQYPDVRRDFYFAGWVPSKPGEVIFVDSVFNVRWFKNNFKVKDFNFHGTKPVTEEDLKNVDK